MRKYTNKNDKNKLFYNFLNNSTFINRREEY